MSEAELILAWQQRQEYLANDKFEREEGFLIEEPFAQDAYISEEERWEELCQHQPSQSY